MTRTGGTRQERWQQFIDHVLTAPGSLAHEVRQAAFHNENAPPDLASFVDTVARHAYRVTDRQVEELVAAGYEEDEIFEAAVAAATGEANRRQQAALAAIARARAEG